MDDFSRNAVENFLQTVVFVDDKIYVSSQPTGTVLEGKKASSPKTRKPTTKSAEIDTIAALAGAPEKPEELAHISFHDIQSNFAKKHIVCSLHQPQKNHSVGVESSTYKLCACADIVIVDWDLYGDAGVKATTLVENLVIQSLKEDPHQLRLVLIYTDTPNLFDISDKVSENLTAKIPDEIDYKDADKGLAFHTLNARVVVLGKPAKRLDEFKPFEVSEAELPDRAVSEFCKLADGMLQGSILLGLAAVRKQSRKILTKFHSGLDAAFLTHRALGLPHEEAFGHITPLLVAEIEAILEDSLESPLLPDSIIKDWCDKKNFGIFAQTKIKGVELKDFAYIFCCSGETNVLQTPGLKDPPTKKQLQYLLCPDDNTKKPPIPDISSMSELAVLMSQRTPYGTHRKILKLGTVLRECLGQECSGHERYLLCLQPVCDSVRLNGSNSFLFCYMDYTENNVTHIVPDGKEYRELSFNPRKENRTIIAFSANHKKMVAVKQDIDTNHFFLDDEMNEYKWVAQLKPDHAQQAVEKFARELSRVGLTESEWLHRGAKK
jgi:hypothetical protein